MSKGVLGTALAAGFIGADWGHEPGFSVDRRGRRLPKPADPKKKAKRKAARLARRRNRR